MLAELNRNHIRMLFNDERELKDKECASYEEIEWDINENKGDHIMSMCFPVIEDILDPSRQFELAESLKSVMMRFSYTDEGKGTMDFKQFVFRNSVYTEEYWSGVWDRVRTGTRWEYASRNGRFILKNVKAINTAGAAIPVDVYAGETVRYPWEKAERNKTVIQAALHKVGSTKGSIICREKTEAGAVQDNKGRVIGYIMDYEFLDMDAFISCMLNIGSCLDTHVIQTELYTNRNKIYIRIYYDMTGFREAARLRCRLEDFAKLHSQPSLITKGTCMRIEKSTKQVIAELKRGNR